MPSQWTIAGAVGVVAASYPTAQTSFAPLPHNAVSLWLTVVDSLHWVPSQRSMVP